jgi:hypothetical protein
MRLSVFFLSLVLLLSIVLAVLLVESYRECKEVGHADCGRQWMIRGSGFGA